MGFLQGFYKDAWSGEGMGYRVWTTRERQLHELAADISIVGKPREAPKRE